MARRDITDESLGRLRYNKLVDWYEGETNLGGETIRISLNPDEKGDVTPVLTRAKEVFAEFERYTRGAKQYAVEQLLDLKNESWLDEGDEPVAPGQFEDRMTLESIIFSSDGGVTFNHGDGDLFWGHRIQIGMDHTGQFVHADIPG